MTQPELTAPYEVREAARDAYINHEGYGRVEGFNAAADFAYTAGFTAGREHAAADRVADAVVVRQAAEADIARQVLILAEDPKILAMWADTCEPRPVTVADYLRALAAKLARPTG